MILLVFRRYLTSIQMLQFVCVFIHALLPSFYDCGYPKIMPQVSLIPMRNWFLHYPIFNCILKNCSIKLWKSRFIVFYSSFANYYAMKKCCLLLNIMLVDFVPFTTQAHTDLTCNSIFVIPSKFSGFDCKRSSILLAVCKLLFLCLHQQENPEERGIVIAYMLYIHSLTIHIGC